MYYCFILRPSDSTSFEDAGIEPRTGAPLAPSVRRSNHSAISHLPLAMLSVLTQLVLNWAFALLWPNWDTCY